MKLFPALAVVLALSGSVFGADANKPEVGAKRATALQGNVKEFRLRLLHHGASDKPYYQLLLSVPPVQADPSTGFSLTAPLSEAEALKIISHLAESGTLDRGVEGKRQPEVGYEMTIEAGELRLTTSLGWNNDMLKSLDGLRTVLDGKAAKDLDTLLGRLSGHRREWTAGGK